MDVLETIEKKIDGWTASFVTTMNVSVTEVGSRSDVHNSGRIICMFISASEVTTIWRYTNVYIIIINGAEHRATRYARSLNL